MINTNARTKFVASNRRRGLTLIEMLVSLAIMTILALAVFGISRMLMDTAAQSQAIIFATNNGRHALEQISTDLKNIDSSVSNKLLVGTNLSLSYGDNIDNDMDGTIDEELPNGVDDDGDYNAAEDNLHATFDLSGVVDLKEWRGVGFASADWGDRHVDEDVVFSSDTLRFHADPTSPTYVYDEITYSIGSLDGVDHVLLRNVVGWKSSGTSETVSTSGLAYGVLSFNCLYWNPNVALPGGLGWVETWDSGSPPGTAVFDLPAAVAVEVTTYADDEPIESVDFTKDPKRTMTLRTIISVEAVLLHSNYPRL
jgi:prepilin-type N-terminal cleavage/methylation domain-containing protein